MAGVRAGVCSGELQLLFYCLKKWEYDDLPCAKFQAAYTRCVQADHDHKRAQKASMKETPVHEFTGEGATDASGKKGQPQDLSVTQFNKMMKLYPQPNNGQHPYRPARRLATMPYSEDTYNRKTWRGKAS